MSRYILINRIKVQNANAIAGFTWGFPAITHFLGFTHNLSRKLADMGCFSGIGLSGCAVITHKHHVHTYRPFDIEFTQSRNPPYLSSHDKASTPPVIEEGKMNMTVSLVIGYEGEIGNNRRENFIKWLMKTCFLQRLAGGTILNISNIEVYNIDDDNGVRAIKRKLLPGFLLKDRSSYLEKHYLKLKQKNTGAELLDAWLDFSAFKQKARSQSGFVTKHLKSKIKQHPADQKYLQLMNIWEKHKEKPYQVNCVPQELQSYFNELEDNEAIHKLLQQWQSYCSPSETTNADWEYVPKPEAGFLVPIMIGYKAISEVYKNEEVDNTRDDETDVCFVESAHSIGEWLGVHRIKGTQALDDCLWHYYHEKNWYLCKQNNAGNHNLESINENPDDDF